jgi:hypothetical protein
MNIETNVKLLHKKYCLISLNMKKYAFFLIFALGFTSLYSQMFNITLYKVRDLLEFNSAYDQIIVMEMDPAGNLWFNLYNTWGGAGMGKFYTETDEWKIFNQGTDLINKELGLYVNAFAFDLVDSVWVGTDNGLVQFDGNSPTGWKIYNMKNSGLPDNKITAIVVDYQNIKWVGFSNGDLLSFNGTEWKILDKYSGNGNKINDLEKDLQNNIWVARNGTPGLLKYDGESFIEFPGLADVRHIEINFDNQVFVTTKDKLIILQDSEIIETLQPDPRLNCELYEVARHQEGPFVSSNKGILRRLGSELVLYSDSNSSLPDLVPQENYNPVPIVYDGKSGLWFSFIYEGIAASYASIGHMDKLVITVPKPLSIDKPSLRFCYGESITLDAGTNAFRYIWDGANTTDRTYKVYDTKTINLDVIYDNKCVLQDTLQIKIGQATIDSVICVTSSSSYYNTTIDVLAQHVYEDEVPCVATVSPDYKNLIVWERTPEVGTASYNIYREIATDVYNFIGNIPAGLLSVFEDTLSDPRARSYKYKISSVDTCGNESGQSYYHKTMHLQLSYGLDTTEINLAWQNYEGFWFPYYIIYRGTSPDNLYKVDSLPWDDSNLTWTDYNVTEKYYYRVGVQLPFLCAPAGGGKKVDSGPYSHSMSQIEDNRFQTAVKEQVVEEAQLYPNPFNQWTRINFENPDRVPYQLKVTDMSGKMVRSISDITDNTVILLRENLPQGFYMFELKGDQIYRGKFVIK